MYKRPNQLLFKSFDPGFDFRLGRAVQRFAGLPVDLGVLGFEFGVGLVDLPSV
jgi:hypothetical protein